MGDRITSTVEAFPAMRLVAVSIFSSAVILVAARVIVFDYVDYNPKESDLIDYGNLKLTKVKNKNIYNLRGNFSILRPIGNEKLVKFELLNGSGGVLMRHTIGFCVYAANDKMIWQELVKASNLPSNCPLPAVSFDTG